MKQSALSLLLILSATTLCFGAPPDDEIRSAEKAWAEAVKNRNFNTLEKIFTPELIYAHSTGAIETKQQYLDRLRSGAQRYDGITHETIKVIPYGDSAVAHSLVRMTGANNSGSFNDRLMMMHLWVKQGGSWRLAAHQTTKIP